MDAAKRMDSRTYVAVLLGGQAGLRAGEIMALEWTDVDFVKNQVCVERSNSWRLAVRDTRRGRFRNSPVIPNSR